jgi:hypothetical protein
VIHAGGVAVSSGIGDLIESNGHALDILYNEPSADLVLEVLGKDDGSSSPCRAAGAGGNDQGDGLGGPVGGGASEVGALRDGGLGSRYRSRGDSDAGGEDCVVPPPQAASIRNTSTSDTMDVIFFMCFILRENNRFVTGALLR